MSGMHFTINFMETWNTFPVLFISLELDLNSFFFRSEKLYVTKNNRDEEKSSRCGKYLCIFLGLAVILGGIAVAILVGGKQPRVNY